MKHWARSFKTNLTVLLSCCVLLACDKPTTRLIEISDVTRDDDAQTLSVSGSGFPGARTGEAELTGMLYRPGARPRPIHLTVLCRALSEELLRVDLRSAEGSPFESGLFEGTLEVHFASNEGASQIVGSLSGVRLRFDDSARADLSRGLALSRRARAFQRSIGALEMESTARGLVVTELSSESPLAERGIQVGDRIERMDDAPVERVADFLPADETGAHILEIVRKAGGVRERVTVSTASQTPFHAVYLAVFACLIGLGASLTLPRKSAARPTLATGRIRLAAAGLSTLTFLAFGGSSHALDVRLFFGLPALGTLALIGTAFARKQLSGTDALDRVLNLSAACLGVATLAVLSGSLTQDGSSAAASPLYWTLLSTPPAWLALVVMAARRPEKTDLTLWPLCSAWLRLTLAACVVALSAGGGSLPAMPIAGALSVTLSITLFALKTYLVDLLLSRLAFVPARPTLVACALACPVAAGAFLTLSLRAELFSTFGTLALSYALSRALLGLVLRPQLTVRDPALTPFL